MGLAGSREGWLFPTVIDNTMCKAWKSCPEKFFRSHVLGWRLSQTQESTDLVAGGAMAKGMEEARKAFYVKGEDAENSIQIGREALVAAYGPEREGEKKSLQKCLVAYTAYWGKWPLDHQTGIIPVEGGIEYQFSVPLAGIFHPDTGANIGYAGRLDMLGRDSGGSNPFDDDDSAGFLWGVDEKTAGSLGSTWSNKYDLDFQMLGYTWASRKLGEQIEGMKVRGIALANKVKFDPITDLRETVVYPRPELLGDWEKDMRQTVKDMIAAYVAGDWRKNFSLSCQEYMRDCAFKPGCLRSPSQPEYQVVRWDPMAKD